MSRSRASAKAAGTRDWEVIESRLAEVPALLAERDALAAKLDAVRALHRAVGIYDECDYDNAVPHPCPTVRALDATPETGGES